jgi:hypothetical protein
MNFVSQFPGIIRPGNDTSFNGYMIGNSTDTKPGNRCPACHRLKNTVRQVILNRWNDGDMMRNISRSFPGRWYIRNPTGK